MLFFLPLTLKGEKLLSTLYFLLPGFYSFSQKPDILLDIIFIDFLPRNMFNHF